MKEFTEKEFDKLCQTDKGFKKTYNEWLVFEVWLANQGAELQKEIDHRCRQYIEDLYGTEENK